MKVYKAVFAAHLEQETRDGWVFEQVVPSGGESKYLLSKTENEVIERPIEELELTVDRVRLARQYVSTGIFVRATLDGAWDSYDICALTTESLRQWLDSKPRVFVRQVVLDVLQHHDDEVAF